MSHWSRTSLFLGIGIVTMLVLGSCSSNDSAQNDIPVGDSSLIEAGDVVYQASCASCHGANVRGTDKGPSLLSVVYEPNHHSDAAFLLAVRNGSPQHHWRFGDMEPVEGLSDDDITALTAYVREQQRIEGFESYPP